MDEAGFGIAEFRRCLKQAEALLHRGIGCGALADPWNVLGFQAQFPRFQALEDSVRDGRCDDLIAVVAELFDLYGQLLNEGADLAKDKAPKVKGKAITIEAEITRLGTGGVVVAQGGSAEGYTLYVKGGHALFAVRRAGMLVTVTSNEALPPAPFTLSAELGKEGGMTLSVGGKEVAKGKAAGTLTKTPQDGLQVGRDANAAVGEYEAPFPFDGEIGKVAVKVGE